MRYASSALHLETPGAHGKPQSCQLQKLRLCSDQRLRPVSQNGRRWCAEVLLCTLAPTFHSGKKASSAHSLCEVSAVPGM